MYASDALKEVVLTQIVKDVVFYIKPLRNDKKLIN